MVNTIEINKADIQTLESIFTNEDKQDVTVHFDNSIISSRVYINSLYEESKLYFYINNKEIVVQNIYVTNQRIGIGTKLIRECAHIGKIKGVNNIRVQSVLSDEMVYLCNKLNFKQDMNRRLLDDKGDYISAINNLFNC